MFFFDGEHWGDRDAGAGFLRRLTTCASPVGNGLAVQGQRGGELAGLALYPLFPYGGERHGLDPPSSV